MLLTLDAFRASLATVASNRRDPDYQPYHDNGQLTAIDMRNNVERQGMLRRFRMSLDLYLNSPTRFNGFTWSEAALEELYRIVEICRSRGIDLKVIVPPTHAAHAESIRARGLWNQYERWKRRLAAVTPYWDFSGYNRVTMEPLAEQMSNYWDISHYRSSVGDVMLSRIFSDGPDAPADGFGWRVTEENVERALDDAVAAREDWRADNGELLALIESIIERSE
ncbi:MAG: hypothetical protein AAFX10_02600 [Pseudomonadota bacterium]